MGDPLTGTCHSSSIATRSSIRRRQNAVQSFRRREFITLLDGAAAAWPLPARAQQPGKPHRVCFLARVPGEDGTLMQPLLERLHELGYSEGKNMTFEYRSAEGCPERLPSLALELVRANPDVLIAGFGTLAAQADYPSRLCDCRRPIGRRYRRQPRSPWREYHSLRARTTPAQCVPRTALSSSHPAGHRPL